MIQTLYLLLALLIIGVFSWWAVGVLIQYLRSISVVDTPNERSLHQGQIPRGGGLVIVTLLLLSLLTMAIATPRSITFLALFVLTLAWAVLSWVDDRTDLSPRRRLLFQLGFAACTVAAFGWVNTLQISSYSYISLSWFGLICTFIGVLWLSNLYNFMDGMDGLAASQTIIAATTIAFWFWQAGDTALAICCMVLAAASYGFLLRNWHPAKVFMGDVGSITIGAFFATMLIYGQSRYQIPAISFVLLLAVFVFDSSVTILKRIWRREKFWLPHRSHYYQRAALLGFNQGAVTVASVVLMIVCAMIASVTVLYHDRIAIAALAVLMLLMAAAWGVALLEARHAGKQ